MTSTTAYLLYMVFALGGAGLYLMMPNAHRRTTAAGAIVGTLATIGLLIVLGSNMVVADSTTAYFYLFSLIAIVCAARVVTHPNPVYSALYFVLVVIAVAALLVLQQAEFLAVALVMIYAGAILVTYLFVIMLAQQKNSPTYDRHSREPFLAVLAGFVLMAAIAGKADQLPQPMGSFALAQQTMDESDQASNFTETSNTLSIGSLMMTRHVVALEVAGVLLLVSMIGAIAMSRKKVPAEGVIHPAKPIGQIGREVKPF